MNILQTAQRFLGPITTKDHRRRRFLNLVQSAVTNLGNKMLMVVISFISVPLTIGYLGREQYGAWVTIGSLLAWMQLADFGVGNGLTNAITTAAGQDRDDLVRMHLSNGIMVMSSIGMAVVVAMMIAWPWIDWAAVFGVTGDVARTEVGPAMAAALAIFCLQFPLNVGSKVYSAYQEGRIGSYWGTAGNLLSLIALLLVTQSRGGLVALVLAVSGTSLLVNFASNAWIFLHHRPTLRPSLRHVVVAELGSLGRVGGKFFLIQIMALVTFQTDNLVIGHYLGAAHVPEYSLTYSLFSYTGLPQSILFSYLWVAYTEAIARKDIAWVARAFRLNLFGGLAFTAFGVAALCAIARPFIGWWAGHDVEPSFQLVGWMAAWSLINAFTNPIACLLAAAAHLKAQLVYSAVATVSNIVLSIYLVQHWGIEGVIAATVISYSVFVCLPIYFDSERLIRKLARAA